MRLLLSFKLVVWISLLAAPFASAEEFRLKVLWGQQLNLSHSLKELQGFKRSERREKDPASGKLARWSGVLLSEVVERAIQGLKAEERALIDLVIVRNAKGEEAQIPRGLANNYPFMLAWAKDGQSLGDRGPVQSVAPWTTSARLHDEGFSLETFFVSGVAELELARYRDRYGKFFLKRRTDPKAMRGEKLFVQSCVGCHSDGGRGPSIRDLSLEARSRALASVGHPQMAGFPRLSEKDRKALVSYLNAFRTENQMGGSAGSGSGAHAQAR